MNGYKAFLMYLALKAHLAKPEYDFFRYNGRVSANYDTFEKRDDKYFFISLAKKYPTKERLLGFLLSNMLVDRSFYVRDFKSGIHEKIYQEWLGRIESLGYIFEQDMQKVKLESEKTGESFRNIFKVTSGKITSRFLEMSLEGVVSLEAYVIADSILGLEQYYDGKVGDPLYTPFAFKAKKYSPFLQLDRARFTKIIEQFI